MTKGLGVVQGEGCSMIDWEKLSFGGGERKKILCERVKESKAGVSKISQRSKLK